MVKNNYLFITDAKNFHDHTILLQFNHSSPYILLLPALIQQ